MDLYAIYLVSDSVGETADVVIRSALYQFETENYQLKKYSYVQTTEEIDDICAKASEEGKAMIFYTFVKKEMADHMMGQIEKSGLIGVDIYSPILTGLGQLFQLPARRSRASTANSTRTISTVLRPSSFPSNMMTAAIRAALKKRTSCWSACPAHPRHHCRSIWRTRTLKSRTFRSFRNRSRRKKSSRLHRSGSSAW